MGRMETGMKKHTGRENTEKYLKVVATKYYMKERDL